MKNDILYLKFSSFLRPTHILGPFSEMNSEESSVLFQSERSSFAMGSSLAAMQNITTSHHPSKESVQSTLTRLQMGRYDTQSTLSMLFQVRDANELAKNRFAYFQFVVRIHAYNTANLLRFILYLSYSYFKR